MLAYAVMRIVAVVVRRFEHEISQGTGLDVLERAKRARTLGGLIQNVVTALVLTVALLMILRELRLDIMPLLTGAGIAGVALGFGAQTLVRDIISGFFLILENQVRVGDVARVNNVSGLVEAINLRTLVLRDFDGTVHIVPAGEIRMLDNLSMDYAYAVVDVPVAYGQDTDRVVQVLKDVGDELQKDEAFQPFVLATSGGRGDRVARRGERRHPVTDEDRAAQAVRHRARAAAPGQDGVRARGDPDSVPAAGGHGPAPAASTARLIRYAGTPHRTTTIPASAWSGRARSTSATTTVTSAMKSAGVTG